VINKKDVQLIIPMSGTGSRFIKAGYNVTKSMIEVDGKPIIAHVLDMFPGVENVTFICNQDHISNTDMANVLLDLCPTCNIFSIPPHKKGPVYAVSRVTHLLERDKPVIVSYCDFGTVWDFEGFLEAVEGFEGGIPCYTGFHPHMLKGDNYAFCKEEEMTLLEIKEKESFTDNKMGEYASNGVYYFGSGAIVSQYFKQLMYEDINLNGEFYVSLVYKLLLRDGLKTKIFEIDKMLQWGTPYDLEIYQGWSNCFKNLKKEQNTVPEQDFTLILPMAGKGERFSSRGYEQPKPLIPVNGYPMIISAVKSLPKFKDSRFICLEKHAEELIIDREIQKYYPNASVLTIDGVTEGQACTVHLATKNLDDEPILISACDNGACYDEAKFLDLVNDETVDVIVWSFRNNQTSKINPDMYSWLDVDENDSVWNVSCKKTPVGDPLKTHAIIGTFYYRRARDFNDGFEENRDRDIRTAGEFYVDDILNRNIEAGLNVKVFEVDNYVGWGTPDDYETYNYWREHFED
jgi:NDP-sugar pyrophosphorylase family protein